MGGHADPCEGPELGDPAVAKQPGEDVEIGFFEVFPGDDGCVGARGEGEHVEDSREGGMAGEELREGGSRGCEFLHVGVRGDDVGVSLVERWDCTGATPVDQVRGEELDVG